MAAASCQGAPPTWLKKSEGLGAPDKNMRACRVILHADGTLFCLVTALVKDGKFQPEGPGLYSSKDGGESWKYLNKSQPLLWSKDYDVDPRNSNVIYLGAADNCPSSQSRLPDPSLRTAEPFEPELVRLKLAESPIEGH